MKRGVRVRLQRVCFTDYEMDVDGDGEIDGGAAAAHAMDAAMAGGIPEGFWRMAPISERTIRAVNVTEIAPAPEQGQEALTADIKIPPDGLPVDDAEFDDDQPIGPEGLDLGEDGPTIPLEGLAVSDDVLAEAAEEGALADDEE